MAAEVGGRSTFDGLVVTSDMSILFVDASGNNNLYNMYHRVLAIWSKDFHLLCEILLTCRMDSLDIFDNHLRNSSLANIRFFPVHGVADVPQRFLHGSDEPPLMIEPLRLDSARPAYFSWAWEHESDDCHEESVGVPCEDLV